LIEEVEGYEEQAETDPEAVASKLPRLREILEWTEFDSEQLLLRDTVLSVVWIVVENNPDSVEDQYPALIEAALDTTESKIVARKLLHEIVDLVARDIQSDDIYQGFELVESEMVNYVDETVEELDTEERLPANGAMAMGLAQHLSDYADSVSGRAQLAVEAYADALLDLVRYQASEQGLDPIDGYVDLKSRAETHSDTFTLGFSADGSIEDMIDAGETESTEYALRYLVDAIVATAYILAVEETADRILRAEAVIAEQLQ
jgi:chaperonin GroEL (HSP60 family)